MHRSIFKDQVTDKPEVIERGPWRIQDLSWEETKYNRELHRFTSDFCLIQEHGQRLRAYDLRFGFTGKLTGEKVNLPLMGFEFERNESRIVDTKMYRTKAWNLIDFGYYSQCVFGRTRVTKYP
jgi:hypothetical protein